MATASEGSVKGHGHGQVKDQVPKRIKALQFALLSPEDVVSQSVLALNNRNCYDSAERPGAARINTRYGPNDKRLGASKTWVCETCGNSQIFCNGHFGHVKLALPTFHYGYLKKIIEVLNCVCKSCSRILLPETERRTALKAIRRPGLDSLRKKALVKKLVADCRKIKQCTRCEALNGPVRKVPQQAVKIIHNQFAAYTNSNAKTKKKPKEMQKLERSLKKASEGNVDVERNVKRVADDMDPLRVLNIFRKMPVVDVELLGMDPERNGRPEYMIWTHIPAPPNPIRPSVAQELASTEDDITNKLGDIIYVNNMLRSSLTKGTELGKVIEVWDHLQVQIAMYIDGNIPGINKDPTFGARPIRGFCQRLKGKQGRFRGNLSGKRVDFSARTVISPDPNLGIDEVAVPAKVAMHMTYPERVNQYNIDKLRACVLRGGKQHPGAIAIRKPNGQVIAVGKAPTREKREPIATKLAIGDVVERHLEDGDIVLFNRQPSLHKLSILSHRVKVRPWRTFRLNECVCNPYNADFDGDEMNLHVPQTEEARTEAMELMGVKHNLATPKNGTPIIAAIQDFITGAYLISQKDRFFNRGEFMQIIAYMYDGLEVKDPLTGAKHPVQIPKPSIYKPQRLWTGKQVWNVLMKPHGDYPVDVNLEGKGRQFTPPDVDRIYDEPDEDLDMTERAESELKQKKRRKEAKRRKSSGVAFDISESDSYLVIRNSEVMCGAMDKATIGDGKKDSIFYVIMRDFGPDYAVAAMNRMAKLCARWLSEQAFSIGIGDVYPSNVLSQKKDALVNEAYAKCIQLIQRFNTGKLARDPGCDEEQTLENRISGILSDVRQDCGKACFAELSRFNAPLTMAKSGAKGSNINVSQMVATVGQQIIGGKRVVDGFENRTLPHFAKASRDPPSKGFVVNSFFSGLNPTEFIFHAMSGREGLVDTAVKTAETGYMSRRLMKSLEDLAVQYDKTVRNSTGGVVQMKFGDDGLDPLDMEGNAKPVDFERTFMHAVSKTWNNDEPGLLQREISQVVQDTLESEKKNVIRKNCRDEVLGYDDNSDANVDQLESVRNFLSDIEKFVDARTNVLISNQKHLPGSKQIFKISRSALDEFLRLCLRKFEKSKVEAGHAVGAVGAQSIGEPGTQMTLKTFHFAGVAGMSITQGVPRIKEIINASKRISTPVITCALDSPYEELAARFAKAIIQKTYLKDIVAYIDDVFSPGKSYVNIRINWQRVEALGLQITLFDIAEAITRMKGMKTLGVFTKVTDKSHIRVTIEFASTEKGTKKKGAKRPSADTIDEVTFTNYQLLMRRLPNVVVKGYPDAQRAVMKKDDKPDATGREPISVFVEGYGLKQCMNTSGVNGIRSKTNSVMEMKDVLGIEAARATIIAEISEVMKGMDIDPRHIQLLADVMTYKGEVLGITRFGLAKMRDSVLQLASFEKTPDHLFQAAVSMQKDEIQGVSECIIMGQPIRLGTGAMRVFRPLNVDAEELEVKSRDAVEGFNDVWTGGVRERKRVLKSMVNELASVVPDGQFVPLAGGLGGSSGTLDALSSSA